MICPCLLCDSSESVHCLAANALSTPGRVDPKLCDAPAPVHSPHKTESSQAPGHPDEKRKSVLARPIQVEPAIGRQALLGQRCRNPLQFRELKEIRRQLFTQHASIGRACSFEHDHPSYARPSGALRPETTPVAVTPSCDIPEHWRRRLSLRVVALVIENAARRTAFRGQAPSRTRLMRRPTSGRSRQLGCGATSALLHHRCASDRLPR
jgi:hypothetical protein